MASCSAASIRSEILVDGVAAPFGRLAPAAAAAAVDPIARSALRAWRCSDEPAAGRAGGPSGWRNVPA